MKSFLLAIATTVVSISLIFAQGRTDSATLSVYKPNRGSVVTELNINPLSGRFTLNNMLNQAKVRIFTSKAFAFRLGFTASQVDSLYEYRNPYGTNNFNYKDKRESNTLGLNLGFEKHFLGTNRLSPYIGLDATVVNKSTKQERENGSLTTTVKGAWVDVITVQNPNPNFPNNPAVYGRLYEHGYFRYGLNFISGFDFYIARNLFFGYELNLGFHQTDYQKLDVNTVGGQTENPGNENMERKHSSFSFGPRLMNGIRLGYSF